MQRPCTLSNALTKDLSGGDSMAVRGMYSKNTKIRLQCSCNYESNIEPIYKGDIMDAEMDRIVEIPFNSRFTDRDQEVDPGKGVYSMNRKYKDKEWKDSMRCAYLDILIIFFKKLMDNMFKPPMPGTIKKKTSNHLSKSSDYASWFFENYEKDEDGNSVVRFQDLWNAWSIVNIPLPKTIKRQKEEFRELVKNNPMTRNLFHERISIKDKDYKSILRGYRSKINKNDDDNDDNNDNDEKSGALEI